LIKLITGDLEPTGGLVTRNHKARICTRCHLHWTLRRVVWPVISACGVIAVAAAVFAQHHMDQLDLSLSALDYLARLFPGNEAPRLRAHLGRYGVTDQLALQKMRVLSGRSGQAKHCAQSKA